jgi:hypothetical protein
MYLKLNGITEKEISQVEKLTEWDKAIVDAKRGIRRLELAIETCQRMKAAGEAWPGRLPNSRAAIPSNDDIIADHGPHN